MDVFFTLVLILYKFRSEKEINTDLAGNVVQETLLKSARFQLELCIAEGRILARIQTM